MSGKRQSFLLAERNYKIQIFKLEIQGHLIMIGLLKITQLSMVYFKVIILFFQLIKNNFHIYVNI